MTCSDVKLACCRLCKKQLASNLGECIHCGVCKPIEDDKCCWLQRTLFILLVVGTLLATIRYETRHHIDPGCPLDEIGHTQGC